MTQTPAVAGGGGVRMVGMCRLFPLGPGAGVRLGDPEGGPCLCPAPPRRSPMFLRVVCATCSTHTSTVSPLVASCVSVVHLLRSMGRFQYMMIDSSP